jgi:hypothetical protein
LAVLPALVVSKLIKVGLLEHQSTALNVSVAATSTLSLLVICYVNLLELDKASSGCGTHFLLHCCFVCPAEAYA